MATRSDVEKFQGGTRSAERAGALRGRGPWPAASASGATRGGKERRESREKERENDVWGPRVRFEFS